jgi:capsular exopolysaccharide synthesis family protein
MPDESNTALEIPVPGRVPAPAQSFVPALAPNLTFSEAEAGPVSLPLSHYLWILRRHLGAIVAFVAAVTLATAVVSLRLTPIYESTATLYVDRQEARGIIGQDSQASAYSTIDAESFLASQIRMIQSDSVVRPVAQKYGLLDKESQTPEDQPRGRVEEAPILLKRLKVTRPPNTYLLHINYRSPDPQLAADVANGIAQSYIEHTYNIRIRSSSNLSKFVEKQIEELRAKMEDSGSRLAQLERELNVINPEEKTNILSARLMQLNSEFTKAQAERVRAEAAWQGARGGAIEAAQVSQQGEALKRLLERLNEISEKFAEVKAHFGVNHPEFRKIQATQRELQTQVDAMRQNIIRRIEVEFREAENREKMLSSSVGETKAEFDRLNLRSFEYGRAKREAEADKALYDELMRKIREAGINAGFQNNMVRVSDPARPGFKPVFPRVVLNTGLAFLFSVLLAVAAAIVHDTLDNTIRDPEEVPKSLHTRILGALPALRNGKDLRIPAALPAAPGGALVLTSDGAPLVRPERSFSAYDEAVRTIRNSILISDFDRRIRTLLFTSATASEGKSTTAAHMALAHAEQGKPTLLIDCDLRQPAQHRIFQVPLGVGMTNVLNGEMGWREAILRPVAGAPLEVITAGPPSRRAADILGQRLLSYLEEMGREYDMIVLDAPPLLGFAESMQLANAADGVIVITRAGETSRKAVAAALSTLQHLRANVLGLVLNQVKKNHSDHYYHYGYYGKYYKRYQQATAGEA